MERTRRNRLPNTVALELPPPSARQAGDDGDLLNKLGSRRLTQTREAEQPAEGISAACGRALRCFVRWTTEMLILFTALLLVFSASGAAGSGYVLYSGVKNPLQLPLWMIGLFHASCCLLTVSAFTGLYGAIQARLRPLLRPLNP